MTNDKNAVIAIFADHEAADTAVKKLAAAGIDTGGLSALGAALYGSGLPKDSIVAYETAVKQDGFLVTAHGSADNILRAKEILDKSSASRVDLHENKATPESTEEVA